MNATKTEIFDERLGLYISAAPPQESVGVRQKKIVTLDLRLVNPLVLKTPEELSALSTDELEADFYAIVTDLREDGILLDFFVNPDSGLDPKSAADRREVYLQAFQQLRSIFLSPRKDATKLGL